MPKEKSEGLTQLNKKIKELEEQLEIKNKLLFALQDPIEKLGQVERKQYVSDIALFYSKVMKKKLEHLIGDQLNELALIGRTELGSNIIRSNISCFRLIDEWMEQKSNEHFGNLEEIRESLSDDKLLVKEMNEKYGKN